MKIEWGPSLYYFYDKYGRRHYRLKNAWRKPDHFWNAAYGEGYDTWKGMLRREIAMVGKEMNHKNIFDLNELEKDIFYKLDKLDTQKYGKFRKWIQGLRKGELDKEDICEEINLYLIANNILEEKLTILNKLSEIEPEYEELRNLAGEINTNFLTKEANDLINKTVKAMKPLSYEYQIVCELKRKWNNPKLAIGSGMRVKSVAHKYGRIVRAYNYHKYVRKKGKEIVPFLRGPIQDDFEEMAEAAKNFEEYKELKEERNIGNSLIKVPHIDENIKYTGYETDRLYILSNSPTKIRFKDDDESSGYWNTKRVDLTNLEDVIAIEEYFPIIKGMFIDLKSQLDNKRKQNEEYLDKIESIRTLWRLGDELALGD